MKFERILYLQWSLATQDREVVFRPHLMNRATPPACEVGEYVTELIA